MAYLTGWVMFRCCCPCTGPSFPVRVPAHLTHPGPAAARLSPDLARRQRIEKALNRLVARGKPKKVALVAAMRKIVDPPQRGDGKLTSLADNLLRLCQGLDLQHCCCQARWMDHRIA